MRRWYATNRYEFGACRRLRADDRLTVSYSFVTDGLATIQALG